MKRRARISILHWLLPTLFALVLTGCGHAGGITVPWDRPAPAAGLTLADLHNIGELQTVFNQDAGKPRLVLLVSPT
jgi:hypothetical protein